MEMIANKIVTRLTKNTDRDEIEILKMQLGMEVFLHNFLTLIAILLPAWLLGMLGETCIFFAAFGLFRVLAGGVHLNNRLGCLAFTTGLILGGTKLAEVLELRVWILIPIYGIILLIMFLWAPKGTENNPISEEDAKKMKRNSIIVVLIFGILSWLLTKPLRELLTVALFLESLTLLPFWTRFHRFIEP